jgi:putative SOS response-associated peptidase YedK
MCNLYSVTKPQAVIRQLAKAMVDTSGNLPAIPAVFPDKIAPVVMTRPNDGQRELLLMRWGFPSPAVKAPTLMTNIRNTASAWWRPYLRSQHRCLVPVTSFCEYDYRTGNAVPTWFALDDTRPLFFFAGIWRSWGGTRGAKENPVEGNHMLFSFLTTDANAEVGTVHKRAMPVCLLTEADRELWMQGDVDEALSLQRPAPDGTLQIVATGAKQDVV